MTALRSDGMSTHSRAEDRASQYAHAATARSTSRPSPHAPSPLTGPQVKYTVLLPQSTAQSFDERLLSIRREVGRRVDKSHVIRELLSLLEDDSELEAQVVERLKRR